MGKIENLMNSGSELQKIFIEFKKNGQKLTKNQEKIKNLAVNYRVAEY